VTGVQDRAEGALFGLAIGDALGMPTQQLSRQAVAQRWGAITTFETPDPAHPLAHGLRAGSITDDTELALLLARHLITRQGLVDPRRFAAELVEWEESMRARGSRDLLGPSTKSAVEAVVAGTPVTESGRFGTTNGAAMRVAPVGIANDFGSIPRLVDAVVAASAVTHNTGVAIAGAASVAAAISAGIDGATFAQAAGVAVDAAGEGASRGHWVAGGDVARRIGVALELGSTDDVARGERDIYEVIGTSLATQESVPAAFGLLAVHDGDPWLACLAAASLGGDSDTIGAMAGAIGGAVRGVDAFPRHARQTVLEVNGIGPEEFSDLAAALLALR
jgi:ADP-ribosylglycohydrolase